MEPGLVLSIGLILTLALSPLVWSHYYVLALIPVLWLCSRARGSGSVMGMLMAATFVLASSDMLIYVVVTMHLDWAWYTVTQASSWIPLWIGILATIASASPLAHSPGASLPSRTAARVPQPV